MDALNAVRRRALDADLFHGQPADLQRVRSAIPVEHAGQQRAEPQRGFAIDQRNLTGTMDINLTDTTLVSVKTGYFRDDYRDEGVPGTTPVRYRTSSVGLAGVPPELQGASMYQNTPSVQITTHDTTTQTYRAGRLQRGVHCRRVSHDQDRRRRASQRQRRGSTVSGRSGGRLLGFHVHEQRARRRRRSRRVRLLRGPRLRHLRQGLREHRPRLRAGPVDARQPHAESRRAARERNDPVVPSGPSGARDSVRILRQDRARIGAAYDLLGDGRAKVFGSYGRYYDWTKYDLSRLSFGGDIWKVYYRSLDDPTQVFKLESEQHAGPRSVGRRRRISRSPRAQLRLGRSRDQADEPGQLQRWRRIPAAAGRRWRASTTCTTVWFARSRTSACSWTATRSTCTRIRARATPPTR